VPFSSLVNSPFLAVPPSRTAHFCRSKKENRFRDGSVERKSRPIPHLDGFAVTNSFIHIQVLLGLLKAIYRCFINLALAAHRTSSTFVVPIWGICGSRAQIVHLHSMVLKYEGYDTLHEQIKQNPLTVISPPSPQSSTSLSVCHLNYALCLLPTLLPT